MEKMYGQESEFTPTKEVRRRGRYSSHNLSKGPRDPATPDTFFRYQPKPVQHLL